MFNIAIMSSVKQTTKGIEVSVETRYREAQSDPLNGYYLFSYKITIENRSQSTCKLMRRQWFITDSNGESREVEGAGVVGEQPVLAPGESFTYESACNLKSEIGRMVGYYLMADMKTGSTFLVDVPAFMMVVPARLN
jgi:ApaG protein